MRILILSFYYPPDIGPGALRAKSIVDALIKEGPSDLKIDVLTTMPNRYHSLNIPALQHEVSSKISINRFVLPKHKNGILDQSKAFFSFPICDEAKPDKKFAPGSEGFSSNALEISCFASGVICPFACLTIA